VSSCSSFAPALFSIYRKSKFVARLLGGRSDNVHFVRFLCFCVICCMFVLAVLYILAVRRDKKTLSQHTCFRLTL
jgi:hypothetical protein